MHEYEMIKDMCPDYGTMCDKCNANGHCTVEYTAKRLIDKNWCKVPEGSVVISKEKLLEIAADYEKMAMFHLERQRELDQARKQAIKEVLEKVRNNFVEQSAYSCDCSQHCGYYDYKIGISEVVEQIDELAKEMGVEL